MRPLGRTARAALLPLLCLLAHWARPGQAADTFCGQLTIHKQQWFSKEAQTLAAQKAADLRQCLDACCGVPSCNAITFMGFLGSNASQQPPSNCVLFHCGPECKPVEDNEAAEGVISVLIQRKVQSPPNQKDFPDEKSLVTDIVTPVPEPRTETEIEEEVEESTTPTTTSTAATSTTTSAEPWPQPSTTSTTSISTSSTSTLRRVEQVVDQGLDVLGASAPPPPASSTSLAEAFVTRAGLTPVWAVGLAIVIVVVCVGTNMALLSAYLCYRRQRSRMRSAPISNVKAPTLHAFNPPAGPGPVMHSTMA